jgi:hypothetical protein
MNIIVLILWIFYGFYAAHLYFKHVINGKDSETRLAGVIITSGWLALTIMTIRMLVQLWS